MTTAVTAAEQMFTMTTFNTFCNKVFKILFPMWALLLIFTYLWHLCKAVYGFLLFVGSVIFIAPVVCVFQFNNCSVNLDGNTVLLWVLYYFTFYWQQQQQNTIHFGLEMLSVKLTSLDLYLMIMFLSISKNTTINHIILRLFFFSHKVFCQGLDHAS